MGMSTNVVGFKPPDAKWQKMKEAWDACDKAGVEIPDEVYAFFEGEEPNSLGVKVEENILMRSGAIVEYHADMRDGYDIHIDKLPEDVKIVRVFNMY